LYNNRSNRPQNRFHYTVSRGESEISGYLFGDFDLRIFKSTIHTAKVNGLARIRGFFKNPLSNPAPTDPSNERRNVHAIVESTIPRAVDREKFLRRKAKRAGFPPLLGKAPSWSGIERNRERPARTRAQVGAARLGERFT